MILTLAVPPDRRVSVTLPETFIPGSLLRLEINPGADKPKTKESMLAAINRMCGLYAGVEPPGAYLERHHAENLLEEWKEAFPLKPGEQARPLYGLFESDGHEVDRFLAEKRREKALEDAIDAREAADSEAPGQ